MHQVSSTHLRDACLTLMREAYPGGDPNHCWFTWGGPESGVLGTMAELSAEEASTPIRNSGPTVAAIAGHIRFLLQYGNVMFRGEKPAMNWDDFITETDAEMAALRKAIPEPAAGFARLLAPIEDGDGVAAVANVFALRE